MRQNIKQNSNRAFDVPAYTEATDDQLLELIARQRDRKALEEFYSRYHFPLRQFLRRHVFEEALIDEVYNDVMMVVWLKAANFKGKSSISTWVFGIAYNTHLKLNSKESRHRYHELYDETPRLEEASQRDKQSTTAVSETIQAGMAELSGPHQSVIELSYFHGYDTFEISKIVGCPQNTVKTRLFHARKHLKRILESGHLSPA